MADSVKRLVETIFTVVDKATGPIKQINKSMGSLASGAKSAIGSLGGFVMSWQGLIAGVGVFELL